jgi:phospholipid/cholesterol/gamma-HCH transport system substrate-binding protein
MKPASRLIGRSAWHAAVALVAMAVAAGTTVFMVEYSAGDFASTYHVTAAFPTAGEGLHTGSEVVERGVQIGAVRSISLANGRAEVAMAIGDGFKLPSNATATLRSENLFGAEQVVLEPPAHPAATSLQDGALITDTRVEDQLGTLFASATPLLDKLDTTDLANVITELAQAAQGEGPAMRASLDEGTRLADLLDQTSTAQLTALDAFSRFMGTISSIGPSLNEISNRSNQSLPLFTRASVAYHNLLADVSALSDHVATLISDYRPDIATILRSGGNVTRVLIADQPQLEQVITGLYEYAYRFGHSSNGSTLSDGSQVGYFKTFVDWIDVERLVCGLIAPPVPGLSSLEPLQQAVGRAGGPLDCSSQIRRFDAAQRHPGRAPKPAAPPLGPSLIAPPSLNNLTSTGKQLAQNLYGQLATPQPATSESVGTYIASLLGNGGMLP